jgi:glycosyltransferase involved in cell wall biosynthesis
MKKLSKKSNQKFVSIITVVLNGGKTLERTIQSILKQSYKNFELIIIDGGSTDNTLEIINKYKNKKIISISKKDKGIYYAMNKGIKIASGEIIGILNADDIYLKNTLKIVNFYFTKYKHIDFLFGSVKKDRVMSGYHPEKIIHKFNIFPGHSSGFFIKRKVHQKFGLYNTKFKYSADFDLMYRLIVKYKLKGMCTKKNEVTGIFSMQGISNKVSFYTKLKEETRIRLHNKQSFLFVMVLNILHSFNYIFNKLKKL